MIDGQAAYLWYVSPNQINAQVPDDTKRGRVNVVVTNALGTATSAVTLADFAPAFSLLDATHVAGIILRKDGSGTYGGGAYDIIGPRGNGLGYPTVPVRAGDEISLFGVGFGPTLLASPAGKAYSGALPVINSVVVKIGDAPVVVLKPTFAGITSAGLYQINLTIPEDLGAGDLRLVAATGNTSTQAGVTIASEQ